MTAERPPLRGRLLAFRDDLRQRLSASEAIETAWLIALAAAEVVLASLHQHRPEQGPDYTHP